MLLSEQADPLPIRVRVAVIVMGVRSSYLILFSIGYISGQCCSTRFFPVGSPDHFFKVSCK